MYELILISAYEGTEVNVTLRGTFETKEAAREQMMRDYEYEVSEEGEEWSSVSETEVELECLETSYRAHWYVVDRECPCTMRL